MKERWFQFLDSAVTTDERAREDTRKGPYPTVPIWRNKNIFRKTKLRLFNTTNVNNGLVYASIDYARVT